MRVRLFVALVVLTISVLGLFSYSYVSPRKSFQNDRTMTDKQDLGFVARAKIGAKISGGDKKVVLASSSHSGSSTSLSRDVIKHIKRFVMFTGYARSGHSIMAALMDSHPHVVISDGGYSLQTMATVNKSFEQARQTIFNNIYQRSVSASTRFITHSEKGYTLSVQQLWQGKFDKYIEVIGIRKGAMVARNMDIGGKEEFMKFYNHIKLLLGIPVFFIHPLRNPYDMISTGAIVHATSKKKLGDLKAPSNASAKFNNSKILSDRIEHVFSRIHATHECMEGMNNVLQVHNSDLVHNPKETLRKIFNFLKVEVSEDFLEVCAKKVFKTVSRSRNLVVWTPEQIERVASLIQGYSTLNRYSFYSD